MMCFRLSGAFVFHKLNYDKKAGALNKKSACRYPFDIGSVDFNL